MIFYIYEFLLIFIFSRSRTAKSVKSLVLIHMIKLVVPVTDDNSDSWHR